MPVLLMGKLNININTVYDLNSLYLQHFITIKFPPEKIILRDEIKVLYISFPGSLTKLKILSFPSI